jgi:hypothetical protein
MSRYSRFLCEDDEVKRTEVMQWLSRNEDVPRERLERSEEHMDALLYMAQETMTAEEIARAIVLGSIPGWATATLRFNGYAHPSAAYKTIC